MTIGKENKITNSGLQRGLSVAALFLLVVFFSLFFLHKIDSVNFEFGQNIRSGELLVQQKQIANSNYFSFVETDFQIINRQWGSDIIFYFTHYLGGLSALTFLALLLNLISFVLILLLTIQRKTFWLVVFSILLVLPLITFSTVPNPEMFSLLFFALSIFLIIKYIYGNNRIVFLWMLPIIQLLWVNIDSLFYIGIILQLILLLHLIINKTNCRNTIVFSIIFVLSMFACFINPNDIDGVTSTIISLTVTDSQTDNVSFMFLYNRLSGSLFFFYFEFIFLLAAFLLYFWINNRELSKQNFFVIILFLISILLVLWRIKMAAYFGYVTIIMAIQIGKQFNYKTVKQTSIALMGILLVLIIIFRINFYLPYHTAKPGTGIENKLSGGANYFITNKLQGPIFNTPEMGAYLTYYLYPKEHVFADKSAYADGFMAEVLLPTLKDQKRWLDLDNKYNFNVVYLNYDTQVKEFTQRLFMDSSWFLAYYDEYCLIFLKRNKKNDPFVRSELLNKITLTKMMHRFKANKFQIPY